MRNRKKSNDSKKKSINDPNQMNTSVEIPMYAPNMGLSPREYQVYTAFLQLEDNFEPLCKQFLQNGNPDEYNSTYMDSVVERTCIDAIQFFKVQRCDHISSIQKLLNEMHNGDYIKCKSKLGDFKRDKEVNFAKLKKYKKLYYHGTSLEEEED